MAILSVDPDNGFATFAAVMFALVSAVGGARSLDPVGR